LLTVKFGCKTISLYKINLSLSIPAVSSYICSFGQETFLADWIRMLNKHCYREKAWGMSYSFLFWSLCQPKLLFEIISQTDLKCPLKKMCKQLVGHSVFLNPKNGSIIKRITVCKLFISSMNNIHIFMFHFWPKGLKTDMNKVLKNFYRLTV
jgi:hypothetical protein